MYIALTIAGLSTLYLWPSVVAAVPLTAQHHLERAWRFAGNADRYEYDTTVLQTIRPTNRLENAGRHPATQRLMAQGAVDRPNKAMQMRLWSPGVGKGGVELKVESGKAFGRTNANAEWEEIPNPTDIFAPGGDPLGFLMAAENVKKEVGSKEYKVGGNIDQIPYSLLPTSYSRFSFDINGPRYADYMRRQLEGAMRERGELPPGVTLGVVHQFAHMAGHGEIWLNEDGLPVRQVITLEFPPEKGAFDRIDAEITTNFSNWEPQPQAIKQWLTLPARLWENPNRLYTDPLFLIPNPKPVLSVVEVSKIQNLKSVAPLLGLSLLLAALALFAITHRRSPHFYGGLAAAVILSMLVTPLMQSNQVHAFVIRQRDQQAQFEQQQAIHQQAEAAQSELTQRDFNPTLNPLAETLPSSIPPAGGEATIPPPSGRGLGGGRVSAYANSQPLAIDNSPAPLTPNPTACDYHTDSDGDTLTDYTECYKLDTFTDTIDSDVDGISDITEVQGFTLNGNKWYLNPLDTDSNGDGFTDAVECPALADVDEMGNLTNPLGSTCVDTDGDKTPDVFDFDNDGDGVPDRIDASPNYVGNLSANAASDFSLALDGYDAAGRMLVVDFQLRPTNIDHLFQTNNVFDWPENDTQGQITRINDNTLADLGYNGARTNRGDIILSPMLEIKIPDPTNNPDNPSGGLPVRSGFTGDFATSPLTDWLDTGTLDHFNITVNHDETDDTLTAYMPLTLVEDTLGDTPVAWGTQMVYQPEGSLWGDDHEVRLVWLVQALLDSCDISGIGEDDAYEEWCATDGDNWVTNMTVVQTYYEDFTLTGLSVREDYGMDLAVIAQTDALTVDYENYLWHLSNNLLATFGEGRLIDDNNDDIGDRRFDFDEIVTRFGGTSGTMWDIPVNLIAVNSMTYTNQITGLARMIDTQIPDVLSTHYSGATTDDDVTLLFAREESYKTTSLGSASVDDTVSGKLTVSLGGLTQQTYSTLNWSPYQYDASGEWLSKDLYDYFDILEIKLTSAISNGEIDSMLGWFGESGQEFSTLTKGAIGLARNYYTTMYLGNSNLVFDSDYGNTSNIVVDDDVLDLDFDDDGSTDEAALLIVGTSLGLMQLFFQREGDLILDEVYEILLTIGEIEEDIDDDDDPLAQTLAVEGIKSAKSLVKKLVKELQGKVKGSVKYYKYRSYTTKATTAIGVLSGAAAAANFLFFDNENQYLIFASNTLDLVEVTLDTADTAYTYYRLGQGFGVADIMVVETTTSKLESSTRTSAIIGLVADVAVASTMFAFSAKNVPPGSLAFNAALAQFIADIITAIIIAIIAATIIGSLVLAVIGLIDAVIAAVCRWNGQDEPQAVEVWVCGGIENAFTTALRYAIYDQYMLVDMDKKDRLSIGLHDPILQQIGDTSGYVEGNELQVGATMTTSLTLNDPEGIVRTTYVKNGKLDRDTLKKLMRKSTFAYKLQHGEYDIHSNLDKGDVNWGSDNTEIFTSTTAIPLDTPGINYSLPLYLTEGFHLNVIECWGFVGAVEEISCKQRSLKDSSHIYLGDDFTMDILPATLDEFISVTSLGNQSYRLSWDTRFSTLIDGDGDGLRSKATGGPDPDDNTWDADSDGLTDFWELDNGFDPLQADGDNDNLFDYWEAFYNTNPRLADTDSDGLLDGEEFYHSQSRHPFEDESQPWSGGWDVIYPDLNGQTHAALVSADPLAYDGDNDSISDKREQIYGYNPNLASVLNILSLNSEVTSPAVQSGGTVGYTATIKNDLDGRTLNGLLQAELPVDVVRNTQVMDELAPLETITLTGQVTVPVVVQSTPTSLTIRAGVVVSSSIVEADPPGPVFYLSQFASNPSANYSQNDDSGYNHTLSCDSSGNPLFDCPTGESAIVNDGFSFDEYQQIEVAGKNSLKLGNNDNTFSMMMWIYPQQGYSPNDLHFDEFGRTVLGTNFFNNPETAFPSLTLKGGFSTAGGMVHFGHADGLGYCQVTGGVLPYNEWSHYAVTFDGGQFKFYVDGELQSTKTGNNCAGQDLYPAKNFTIGHTEGVALYFKRMVPKNATFDEGYLWSDDNDIYVNESYLFPSFNYRHRNPNNQPEMLWFPGIDHIHENDWGDEVNYRLENWALSGKNSLTFWACNMDDESAGYPHGCLDSDFNADEPMYYKKDGSKEYERTYTTGDATGEYVVTYKKGYKNNKWGGPFTYDLYNNAFKGKLDEIALYNTSLSKESVEDIYIASLRTAYLTFDEPPGQDIFEDATAYNTVATCTAPHCPDSGIPGRDNQAMRFDGADDYVQFPQPLDPNAELFTAAAWFKVNNLATNQAVLQQQDGSSTGRTWLWVLSNGQLRTFLGGSNLDSGAGNVVTPGQWHHAAVTANSGTIKLYLDGQLVNQASQPAQASDGDLLIGVHKSLVSGFFDGLIDEVVVQRGALNDTQIANLMLEAPVLNLHLDENLNVTNFSDDTPYTNDAACSGNTCPETGTKGQIREAIILKRNDVISTSIANVNIDKSNFSVAMWVRPDQIATSGDQNLLDMGRFRLYMPANSTQLKGVIWDSTSPAGTTCFRAVNLSGADLTPNQWNHVAFTIEKDAARSGTGYYPATLFLNGVQVAQQYTQSSQPICDEVTETPILGDNFIGDMDEVSIFGVALRGSEIKDLYDYQAAWFDQTAVHRIMIDTDDPQVSLGLATGYLPLAETLLSIDAFDISSGIASVQVTVTAPDGITVTNATPSDDPNSDAWFYTFNPNVAGAYTIDLLATDMAGNTNTGSATFDVDGAPPSAGLDSSLTAGAQQTSSNQGKRTLNLFGPISDSGSPASGVASNTIAVEMLDWQGLSVGGSQFAAYSGGWQVDYPFTTLSYGQYDVRLSAEDIAGNVYSATLGSVDVDDLAPSADIILAGTLITKTGTVLTGTVTDIPYPNQSKRLHLHFEESSGVTQFVDGSVDHLVAACVTDCPTAGQPGNYGDAVAFDGANDVLTVATVINPISHTFTALGWFNLTDTSADYTLLAQESGPTWLSVLSSDKLNTSLGGANLTGPTSVTPGQWHHAAVSYDGSLLSLYLDGTLEVTATRSMAANESDMVIGANGSFGSLFKGRLDELVLYDSALSADQIYDIANPLNTGVASAEIRFRHLQDAEQDENEGNWYSLTLASPGNNFSTWSFTPPNDLEGPYKIDLRATDDTGNTGFLPNMWNGNIDLVAPRLTLNYSLLSNQYARAECYAYDFNITSTGWTCPADNPIAVPESADWFVQTFTATTKTTAYSTTLQTVSAQSDTLTACDIFGHCATTTITNPTLLAESIAIVTPTETAVITGLLPIEVAGYARSYLQIKNIELFIDGQLEYDEFHGVVLTETNWSTYWQPEQPGTYTLEAVLTTWSGHSQIVDPVQVEVHFIAPKLNITKTIAPANPGLGDPLTYTIIVSNSGNLAAGSVRITDTLPTVLTGPDLDQTVTLPVGAVVSYTIPATVTSEYINIANTAWVSHTWERNSALSLVIDCNRFEVLNDHDSGPGSLRHAIENTCGSSLITFSDDFTIEIAGTLEVDNANITIDAGARNITLSSDPDLYNFSNLRLLDVTAGSGLTLTNVAVIQGSPAIRSRGALSVISSTFKYNDRAIDHNSPDPLVVSHSTFYNNFWPFSSENGAGLYLAGGGAATVTHSLFQRNFVRASGAGIYNNGSTLTVINSTFYDNWTMLSNRGGGAGIYNNNGQASIVHSTFSNNRTNLASSAYPAFSADIHHNSSQSLLLTNSILANSQRGRNCTTAGNGPITTTNTLIEDNTCGATFSGDPILSGFDDYGGQTGTYALQPQSPAIDAADPTYCPSDDQRDLPRPHGAACDLGAFESQGYYFITDGSDQSAPLNTNFSQPLSVTVYHATTDVPVENGVPITLTSPAVGAGLAPVQSNGFLNSQGHYEKVIKADANGGTYLVTATVTGVSQSANFTLTNLAPDLVISKTLLITTPEAGQPISYSIAFANTGNTTATNVIITDTLPPEMTAGQVQVISASDVPLSHTVSNQTFEVFETAVISPGQRGIITLTGLLTDSLSLAQPIVNQVEIEGAILEAVTGNNQVTVSSPASCYPATRLYVDADAAGANTGLSWTDAITRLQDALSAAGDCGQAEEIWVAEGIYYPDEGVGYSDNNRAAYFTLQNGLALYGGFNGTETLFSQRSYTTHITILSGDIRQNDITSTGIVTDALKQISNDNARRVVVGSNTDNTAVLDGFTLTAGRATGSGGFNRNGGGVHITSGNPTLRNLVFSGNYAQNVGGGLYTAFGDVDLLNVTFVGNRGTNGGGVYQSGGQSSMEQVVFNGNRATTIGGGLYTVQPVTLTNAIFSGNDAASAGGAIANIQDTVTLLNVTFGGNSADNSTDAIYSDNPLNNTLTNVVIWNNGDDNDTTPFNEVDSFNISHSVIQGGCPSGATCSNVPDDSPVFVTAPDPAAAPSQNGDLRLLPGSAAINAGTNSGAPADDIRGIARPINGTVDAGAYESQGFTLTYGSGSNQLAVIGNAFADPLTVTISSNANEPVGPGGQVDFDGPTTGASLFDNPTPGQTDAGGVAAVTAIANSVTGSYLVTATARNVSGQATFALTNTEAVLVLLKQVSPVSAAPGETVTYTLVFSNGGITAIPGIIITDNIPISITVPQVISGGDVAITRTVNSQTAQVFELAPLNPNDGGIITLTAQLTSPLASGPLRNTAILTSQIVSGGSTELVAVELTVLNVAPIVTETTSSTSEKTANDTVIGMVTSSDANNDVLSYTISSGNPGNPFGINATTGQIFINDNRPLDFETQPQYILTVEANDGGLTATTTVTVNLTDVDTDLTLTKAAISNLPADASAPTDYLATPGGTITYTLTFRNNSGDDATDIVITDALPSQFPTSGNSQFTIPNSSTITQTGTNPLQWEIDNLAAGEEGVITLTGQVTDTLGLTIFTNTAYITSATPDVNLANNLAEGSIAGCAFNIEVQNNSDTGSGSLWQAIADLCEGGTITFASDMTITLPYTDGGFSLKKGLTIDGTGRDVIIAGDDNAPIWWLDATFNINQPSGPITLTQLTLFNPLGPALDIIKANVTVISMTVINGIRLAEAGYITLDGGSSHLTLVGSSIVSNTGSGMAGILVFDGTAEIINSTIAHNVFLGGAGLDVFNGAVTVTHSTIAANGAQGGSESGNIVAESSGDGTITLQHSIVAGGVEGGVISDQDCNGTLNRIIDAGYNLMGSTCSISTTTTSHIDSSRVFTDILTPWGDYGGSTPTFALLPGSPALDSGSSGSCVAVGTDQRGLSRPYGDACDIGAFESRGYSLALTGSNQTTLINTAFITPLQVALVSGDSGVPVGGRVITLTAPLAGASITTPTITATTNAAGVISAAVIANGSTGSYAIAVTTNGLPSTAFNLSNALPNADLQITKLVTPTTVEPGQAVTFTLSFANIGLSPATGVVITDIIPNQIGHALNATYTVDSGVTITRTPNITYEWTVSDLAFGQGGVITITGIVSQPLAAGLLTNTGIITGLSADDDAGNNRADMGLIVRNLTPTLAILDPIVVTGTELLTITFVATDVNGDSLAYSLVDAQVGMNINGDGIFTWQTPKVGYDALYTTTVVVSDGVLSDSQDIFIVVYDINEAPFFTSVISDQTVTEGQTVGFTVTTEDNDIPAQSLTLSLSNAPVSATLDAGGNFSWPTTEADGPGVYSATIRLSDGSLTISQTVLMTVTEQNQAPVLAAIVDQLVAEGGTISFTAIATDTDIPAQVLTYSLSNAPAGATLDGGGNFSWPTTETNDGTFGSATVRVSDGLLTTSQTITLTVIELNTAPSLSALSNQTISEGDLITFTATATDTDLPLQSLTFSLAEAPVGAVISNTGGLFSWQSNDSHGGAVYTVTIVVSDGTLTDSQTILITVDDVNVAPTFVATLAGWTVNEGAAVSLNAVASDPDLPAQVLTYSVSDEPVGMSIDGSGQIQWATDETDNGLYNVTVRVSDGLLTSSQTIAITVTEINQAPTLATLSDVAVNEGDLITFTAVATDTDLPAQSLTYTLETDTAATLSNSGAFSWTTTENDGGEVSEMTIYVNDGVVTTSQTIAMTVTEVNSAPALVAIGDKTVVEGGLVSFSAIATDTDDPPQGLTYSLSNAPAEAAIGSNSGDFAWLTTDDDGPGMYTVTVQASDGVLTVSQTVNITVTEGNAAPVITPVATQTVTETLVISFTIAATDDPSQAMRFSLSDAPSLAFVSDDGVFGWQPTEDDGPDVYSMTVYVSDTLLTSSLVITIEVIEENTAPTLAAIADRAVAEGELITFILIATDTDIPAQPLTYTVSGLPAAATVDGSGIFNWQTVEADGYGVYSATIIVSDGVLTDSQSFVITVTDINNAPVFLSPTALTVTEGVTVSFTATATDSDSAVLTYTLGAGAPLSATLTGHGVFTWPTTEADGFGVYSITINVTDGLLTDSQTLVITVTEAGLAPTLAAILPQTITETETLTFTAVATDVDLPADILTFGLYNPPTGAVINSGTGVFTWTPTEIQGAPGALYYVSILVTDTTGLTASTIVMVSVNDVNSAPTLAAVPAQTIDVTQQLTFTAIATDTDWPLNTITYTLVGNPAGAVINPASGVFTFTPPGLGLYTVTMQVTDNGAPPLTDTTDVSILVTNVVLTLTKTVTPVVVEPGQAITYVMVIANSGSGNAGGVQVQDNLPDGIQGDALDWTGIITANSVLTFPLYATVTVEAGYGVTLTNTATFSYANISGNAIATVTTIADTTPPTFTAGALLTPTNGITVVTRRPTFDWQNAFDNQSGVVSYTVLVTGGTNSLSIQTVGLTFTAVESVLTPTVDLADGVYAWTVRAHDAAGNISDYISPAATFVISGSSGDIYLPLIFKGSAPGPDLVVDNVIATSSRVTVTIRNVGNSPVVDAFWVDVYFNPTQTPTINKPWPTIAPAGAIWGVTKSLAQGETLVLTTGGAYYFGPPDSSPTFPVGATVYAYVDSINHNTSYGNVQEGNEGNNLSEPEVSTADNGEDSTSVSGRPVSSEGLPER